MTPLVLGRYRLEDCLGSGGHGRVFLARDELTQEPVAVKLLEEREDDEWVRRELTALRLLRIPGVVALLDTGTHEDRAVIVMERVEGTPFPGRSIPVPWSELAPLAHRLLETVDRIHAAGVVHRDLKPANILLRDDGTLSILDFGVSGGPALRTRMLSEEGLLLGSPAYLAPEQLHGGPLDGRADLYAVGVMLVEALTGTSPFNLSSLTNLFATKRSTPDIAPALGRFHVPTSVVETLKSALSPEPSARPSSALDFLSNIGGTSPHERLRAHLSGASTVFTADRLKDLFVGPDRIFHLSEDAARELWIRTHGHVEQVTEVLAAWTRTGVATWRGDRLRIDRDALDTLASGRQGLQRGDIALARIESAERELELLVERTSNALAEGTPRGFDLALYELGRSNVRSIDTRRLELLLRAAQAASTGEGVRALELLATDTTAWPESFEHMRQGVRALAAHRAPIDVEGTILGEIEAWATAVGTLRAKRLHAEWLGRLRYRQGRFAEAASLHLEEALMTDDNASKMGALLRSASARMECFELERAAELAREVQALAAQSRHTLFEARAEWLVRATGYRLQVARRIDFELLEAIESLGVVQLCGLVALNEAAVAWRSGDLESAQRIASKAAHWWAASSTPPGADLARALAILTGAAAGEAELEVIHARASISAIPSVGLQTLGILNKIGWRRGPDSRKALATSVPREYWSVRMEVLSVEESLA